MLLWITICLVLLGLSGFAYGVYESRWDEVTQVEIAVPQLPPAFEGYRIAHISDIHMETFMTTTRLQHIAAIINEQAADAIMITGDFVSFHPEQVEDALRQGLAAFHAPDGVYAVLGNHDHWHPTTAQALRTILRDVGIHELQNDVVTIERYGQHFYVAGLDDVYHHHDDFDQVQASLLDDAPAMILVHEPDFAETVAASQRFFLQLSGHTHGGQVVLPLLGILYLPDLGQTYLAGQYDLPHNLTLYVTRGIGTVGLPLRFNCRPEITILTLKTASS